LEILSNIEKELEKENIFIINEDEIDENQHKFIKQYFIQKVSPALVTIILSNQVDLPNLKDSASYLAVKMSLSNGQENRYALIEISKTMDRFVVLPVQDGKSYIIMLDDLLRYCLDDIFNIFHYEHISAHMIKIRSEERRVGKECGERGTEHDEKY